MPSSAVCTFSDPDDYGAAIRATRAEITITGRGRFAATLTRIDLGDLWMQRLSETLPRIGYATNVSGRAIIAFRTEAGPSLSWSGVEMRPGSITRFADGQSGFQLSAGGARWASMSLPVETMRVAGAALRGCELAPPRDTMTVTPSASAMGRLQHLHAAVGRLAEKRPDLLVLPEVARAAEQSLVDAMVGCLDDVSPRVESLAMQHQAVIMRRFRRALEACADRAVYIPELCAEIGVSDRTLRACCQEQLGVGPRRYLALRRMHLARRALRDATPAVATVTEVATRFGFWQFGRFAGDYNRLFGELPSATLAREHA